MQMSGQKDESLRSFNGLASEYYDAILHPTCNNFRAASKLLLKHWLSEKSFQTAIEVGCGSSLMSEVLLELGKPLTSVTLTDISPLMIAHSLKYGEKGAQLFVAPADDLPVPPASQDLLVSSLGDPYNDDDFWEEAARVLRSGGQLFFTTPSYEWSNRFRKILPEAFQSKAEFLTAKGNRVWIPSNIAPVELQKKAIERTGFRLSAQQSVDLSNIPAPISHKLASLTGTAMPIVTAYLAERQ